MMRWKLLDSERGIIRVLPASLLGGSRYIPRTGMGFGRNSEENGVGNEVYLAGSRTRNSGLIRPFRAFISGP